MMLPDFPDRLDEVQRRTLAQFRLDVLGTHGLPHWRRTYRNGILIAKADSKIDLEIVTLFALLHDSQRDNEYDDPMHGVFGAQFAEKLAHEGLLGLDEERLTILKAAITDHPRGAVLEGEYWGQRTIQACWDADRLDLPRIGVEPDPRYLGSTYGLMPGIPEAHWEEAWNTSYPEAMIEA